jgi:FtsH-binding integral membrane protein
MLNAIRRYTPAAISVFASLVFLDSLRFKFTDHPNTQEIFGALDGWAGSLGLPGLFGHTGLFSQYVIGGAELVASALLLVGLMPGFVRLNGLGALLGFAVMSGAVSFHLFTPLGIDPNHNGGFLFMAACGVWAATLALIVIRRHELAGLARDLARAVVPDAAATRRAPTPAPARP